MLGFKHLFSAELGPEIEATMEVPGCEFTSCLLARPDLLIELLGYKTPEVTGDGPSTLWGITYVVADIETTAAFFGDRTTPVKDAVQPGRRITTLRHRDLGMSVRSAMISPPIVGA